MPGNLQKNKTTPDGCYTKGWRCFLLGLILFLCIELSCIILTYKPGGMHVFCNHNNQTECRRAPLMLSVPRCSNLSHRLTLDSRGKNEDVSKGMVVLPSFHKKWDINCTKILQGNKEEIQRSVRLLNVWRLDPKRPTDPFMPSDNEVRSWTHDCDVFK